MSLQNYIPPADTVKALIQQHARLQPNNIYALFPETQSALTYQDLEQEILELSLIHISEPTRPY